MIDDGTGLLTIAGLTARAAAQARQRGTEMCIRDSTRTTAVHDQRQGRPLPGVAGRRDGHGAVAAHREEFARVVAALEARAAG
ncbi:hypothetical protein [Streptomyces resistomycificus]|uniref:hypothetical protein n=1 Tax=Streptomyces resistomycificus TaxID=67356 RepID=UPI000A43190A|nr:hypothetical protein [Streptomyces resistomycificus]